MTKSYSESSAEYLVVSNLSKVGIIVCKPLGVDKNGGDFICLLEIEDSAKIGRIQVKGRSLNNKTKQNFITIPQKYVNGTFCLFLYVLTSLSIEKPDNLYCFFVDDLKRWKQNSKNEFRLSININNFESSLLPYIFDDKKVEKLKNNLRSSITNIEFKEIYSLTSGAAVINPSNDYGGAAIISNNSEDYFGGAINPWGKAINH